MSDKGVIHYNAGHCVVLCLGQGRLMSRDMKSVTCVACLEKLSKLRDAGEDP